MTPESNGMWQDRVRALLLDGFGVEDIAIRTGVEVEIVRREVEILRATGELAGMFGLPKGDREI